MAKQHVGRINPIPMVGDKKPSIGDVHNNVIAYIDLEKLLTGVKEWQFSQPERQVLGHAALKITLKNK